jgi:cyclin-dependent kinase-like
VATRWYRSPELLLSGGIYGPDVDYWAVGCIMGELADGNPMFPGENETDQINCIIKVLGNLPDELVDMFYRNPIYEGKELIHVSKVESLERRYLGKLGPTAIDFMKGLLQLDPKKRLNSDTVFKHKYFACFMKDEKEKEKINNISNANIKENNLLKSEKSEKKISNNAIIVNKSLNDKNKTSTNFLNSNNNSNNNTNRNSNSLPKQATETKVINNTTNINIINYNNINNPTNNFIEIHNNNINDNINNSSNNSISKNKKIKDIKSNSNNNNILINNSMIIKVNNSKEKDKLNKIDLNNTFQNNMKIKSINNQNFPNNINKSINMNNSVYNFPIGNKKSLSVNKIIKLNDYQNMTLLNNYPNLMTISLSQGKNNKLNNNSLNNISSTFYSFKNNKNNIIPKKITSFNNSNNLDKNNTTKKNKYNYMSLLPNNYLGGYKTFFNKNNSNDKYNYDINTNYFKDELKKYNSSPIQNYYNNVIDENDEYPDGLNNGINIKSYYNNNKNNKKKNYFDSKKDVKLMTKYKENHLFGKNIGGKFGIKKNTNGYGTLYNYGYGNKKNNVELPQLIQIYNKNTVSKNHNNHYYGLSYNKKY